uniref:Uncharacterized protein n=1 Tax=Kalanchoe fedtschenkoi TaxID=63787 RepID=A0A7N0TWR7_KALFE
MIKAFWCWVRYYGHGLRRLPPIRKIEAFRCRGLTLRPQIVSKLTHCTRFSSESGYESTVASLKAPIFRLLDVLESRSVAITRSGGRWPEWKRDGLHGMESHCVGLRHVNHLPLDEKKIRRIVQSYSISTD